MRSAKSGSTDAAVSNHTRCRHCAPQRCTTAAAFLLYVFPFSTLQPTLDIIVPASAQSVTRQAALRWPAQARERVHIAWGLTRCWRVRRLGDRGQPVLEPLLSLNCEGVGTLLLKNSVCHVRARRRACTRVSAAADAVQMHE